MMLSSGVAQTFLYPKPFLPTEFTSVGYSKFFFENGFQTSTLMDSFGKAYLIANTDSRYIVDSVYVEEHGTGLPYPLYYGVNYTYDSLLKTPVGIYFKGVEWNGDFTWRSHGKYYPDSRKKIRWAGDYIRFTTQYDNRGRIVFARDSSFAGIFEENVIYWTKDSLEIKDTLIDYTWPIVFSSTYYCKLNHSGYLINAEERNSYERQSYRFELRSDNTIDSSYKVLYILETDSITQTPRVVDTILKNRTLYYYSGNQLDSCVRKDASGVRGKVAYYHYNSTGLLDSITVFRVWNGQEFLKERAEFFYIKSWFLKDSRSVGPYNVKLFPNPSTGSFYFQMKQPRTVFFNPDIELYNTMGAAQPIEVSKISQGSFLINVPKYKGLGYLMVDGHYAGAIMIH
ncbi:MAG: hypothetical protein SchgKO_19550 [Schleiferiaceae bacterium]